MAYNNFIQCLKENKSSRLVLNKKKILFLGASESGKTYLISTILERKIREEKKPLYIFNDLDQDYRKKFPEANFHDLFSFNINEMEENSICVAEDVIKLERKKDITNLRILANWACNHRSAHLYVISHSIRNTDLTCLVNQFDLIIFTSDRRNMLIAKSVFPFFGIYELQRNAILEDWEKYHEKNGPRHDKDYKKFYFVLLNCKSGQVFAAKNSEDLLNNEMTLLGQSSSQSNSQSSLENCFKAIESSFDQPKKARAVFHLISKNLKNEIDSKNFSYSLILKSENNKKTDISILDYIQTLLNSNLIPSPRQILFHKFILKKCQLPNYLILNPKLEKNKKTILE